MWLCRAPKELPEPGGSGTVSVEVRLTLVSLKPPLYHCCLPTGGWLNMTPQVWQWASDCSHSILSMEKSIIPTLCWHVRHGPKSCCAAGMLPSRVWRQIWHEAVWSLCWRGLFCELHYCRTFVAILQQWDGVLRANQCLDYAQWKLCQGTPPMETFTVCCFPNSAAYQSLRLHLVRSLY